MFERESSAKGMRLTDLFFSLYPEDDLIVVLKDGEFFGVVGCTREKLYEYEDVITEEIVKALKHPYCRKGYWIFKFSNDWTVVDGMELPVLTDKDVDKDEEEDD